MSLTAEDVAPVAMGAVERPGRWVRRAARQVAPWVVYIACSWLFLYPILTTAIVADDFLNPFLQFEQTGFAFDRIVDFGLTGADAAGHFNYVGQVVGSMMNVVWMFCMGVLGLRYSTVYAATKFVVLLTCALAAASYVGVVLSAAGRPQPVWRCRAVVSAVLFGTLQLHIYWSNDPVGSYPLSGFAAVALGFGVLALGARAIIRQSPRLGWVTAGLAIVAILYYELNAAAVAALLPLYLWVVYRHRASRPLKAAVAFSPMLAAPGLVALVFQARAAPASGNYAGTAMELKGSLWGTFGEALVGSLPAAAWKLSDEHVDRPFSIDFWQVTAFVVAVAGLGVLAARAHWLSSADNPAVRGARTDSDRLRVTAMLLAPLIYGVAATFLQATTSKVQIETKGIGYVYNYYAVGATAVAVLASIALLCFPTHRWGKIVVGAFGVVVALVVVAQYVVNVNISDRFNEATIPNQRLLVAFTESWPEDARCQVLADWTAGPWPDYYEGGMVSGLQHAYERFHGEPFCEP